MPTNKLDDIVNKYNNIYHSTIKLQLVYVKSSTYIDLIEEYYWSNNKEIIIHNVGDHVRISKHKNNFAKGYVPNWSEEDLVIIKVKNTVLWTCVNSDLKGEEIVGKFYEKELQKAD